MINVQGSVGRVLELSLHLRWADACFILDEIDALDEIDGTDDDFLELKELAKSIRRIMKEYHKKNPDTED
jgi:hypothetical protein